MPSKVQVHLVPTAARLGRSTKEGLMNAVSTLGESSRASGAPR